MSCATTVNRNTNESSFAYPLTLSSATGQSSKSLSSSEEPQLPYFLQMFPLLNSLSLASLHAVHNFPKQLELPEG